METFLYKTSQYIFSRHGEEMGNICIVLPNRRAKLFLQRHLASFITKPIWSPEIYAIEDFIVKLSGMKIAENIQLLFELYSTHKAVTKDQADTFDEFMNWGQTLLHDFNDIDMYLVKPEYVFTYLDDAKNITHWNPDKSEPTDNQKKFLQFYSSLLEYYNHFTELLLKKKEVYNGLAYRHVAENIESPEHSTAWEKIYFAGLNAMTISEEKIIRHFIKQKKAEILWDADKYYTDDINQEAGNFLRHYKSSWLLNEFKWTNDNFSSDKNINIIGVPKQIGQVKYAGQLVADIAKADMDNISKTAVVLADENLLLPLLNSMPEDISQFNVTMGLPLKFVPLFDLFNSLFYIHENAVKLNKKDTNGNLCFYFKDLLKFFQHPYITRLSLSSNQTDLHHLINILADSKKVFLSSDHIKELLADKSADFDKIILPAFNSWSSDPIIALEYFSDIIDAMKDSAIIYNKQKKESSNINMELEYLYAFAKIIKRLKSLTTDNTAIFKVPFSLKSLHQLFNQVVTSSTLPFYGEPLKGLQIMGVLETRTLDFENVIMLSVNENLLPSAKTNNSFIPYDIRKKFKLPTYHDRDSIFAYHFYRLLQRAKNIILIYNTENDEFGKGEKSRFITQLIHELPAYNPHIIINNKILSIPPVKEDQIKSIVIEKSEDIIRTMQRKAENGFSPTSLNKFRNCSLQFYFSEIAEIKETEEAEETIEASTLGTIIHEVLSELYMPLLDHQLTKEALKEMLSMTETTTEKAFQKHYQGGDITTGKNLLIAKVAHKFITNFLKSEIKYITDNPSSFIVRNLEHNINKTLSIQPSSFNIRIKGIIDRVDTIDGTTRIIDYKTGNINKNLELNIKDWSELVEKPELDKSFQLLIYSWLYFQNNQSESLPGILSFKQISKGLQTIAFPDKTTIFTSDISAQIESIILHILNNIFDKEQKFIQTDNRKTCTYCPYKTICIR